MREEKRLSFAGWNHKLIKISPHKGIVIWSLENLKKVLTTSVKTTLKQLDRTVAFTVRAFHYKRNLARTVRRDLRKKELP